MMNVDEKISKKVKDADIDDWEKIESDELSQCHLCRKYDINQKVSLWKSQQVTLCSEHLIELLQKVDEKYIVDVDLHIGENNKSRLAFFEGESYEAEIWEEDEEGNSVTDIVNIEIECLNIRKTRKMTNSGDGGK